jgi:putative transposase
MADLEQRGLNLSSKILHITDGGKGVIKALRDRHGKKLAHQRCTIHKDRNIQRHLPKKYRGKAHEKFLRTLELTSYEDAKAELKRFEEWLREINPSAADSLLEAFEEILTLHRLKVPPELRKSLHSTNIIESMFARVRACEKNIKRYRKGDMGRRWLASVLLHAESGFKKIHGHARLGELRTALQEQEELYKEAA